MATAKDVLDVARSLIGVHETPDGSNIAPPITTWAKQYGYSKGDAWCSWTVSYEFYHAGGAELIYNHPSGYSGYFRTMGEKHNLIIPHPKPGAIDVMDFDGYPDFTDHVGIVESVNADGSWVNIEGNHNNQVMRVTRKPGGGSHWFILPKYSEVPQPKPAKIKGETEMILVSKHDPRWFPAGLGGLIYFDVTAQESDTKVQLWFKRDNGDEPDQKNAKGWQRDIGKGTSLRFEASEFFKVTGAINVMVDVLEGGIVLVTRTNK